MITIDSVEKIRYDGLDINWIMSTILDSEFFDCRPSGVVFTPTIKNIFVKCFGKSIYNQMMELYSNRFDGIQNIRIESDESDEIVFLPCFWHDYVNESFLLMDFQRMFVGLSPIE